MVFATARDRKKSLLVLSVGVGIVATTLIGAAIIAWPTPPECPPLGGPHAPEFSPDTGFYEHDIVVALNTSSSKPVLYTLDGSYPASGNPSALTYTGPITVTDVRDQPYALTQLRTSLHGVTTVDEIGDGTWGVAEDGADRATVIRARAVNGCESIAVFFVGDNLQRSELPVMNLSVPPGYLYDYETGINIPGRAFDDFVAEEGFDPDRWTFAGANYQERGRGGERPFEDEPIPSVVLHYFEPGGALAHTQAVGLRIHGGSGRAYPQKSLRIYARDLYGSAFIDYPFFGDDGAQVQNRLILRNSGHDCVCLVSPEPNTHLLDGYLHGLVSHLQVDSQSYQPIALFINGEYWGIQNIRDRQDRHFLGIKHGIEPDAVAILRARLAVDYGSREDADDFRGFLDAVEDADPTDADFYDFVDSVVDLDNYIDYTIVQIFTGNRDWPTNNVKLWRVNGGPVGHTGQGDGRWRWLLYDLDQIDGRWTGDFEYNQLTRLVRHAGDDTPARAHIAFLFDRLRQNGEFRQRFLSRFADHLNTTFHPDRTLPALAEAQELLASEMEEHGARWMAAYDWSMDDWYEDVDQVRAFMAARPDIQWSQLVDFFDLDGTVEIAVETSGGGTVLVNSLLLTESTPGIGNPNIWSGRYFRGIPITVEALPGDGQRFDRWDGLPDDIAGQARITLAADADLVIRAIFVPAP